MPRERSFTIKGNLDISNIISNSEKMQSALRDSLDDKDFKKLERSFDNLARAQTEYQRAMKQDLVNKAEINVANKAIDNLDKTYNKLLTDVQTILSTKGIKLPIDIAEKFKQQRQGLEQELKDIEKNFSDWKNKLQSTINTSSFSKADQQSLVKAMLNPEEFDRQLQIIEKTIKGNLSNMQKEINNQVASGNNTITNIGNLSPDEKRQRYLSLAQQKDYANKRSEREKKQSDYDVTAKQIKELEKYLTSSEKSYQQRLKDIKKLENKLNQASAAIAAAEKKEAEYKAKNPGVRASQSNELLRLQNDVATKKANKKVIQEELRGKGISSEGLEKERAKSQKRLEKLKQAINNLDSDIKNIDEQTKILDNVVNTKAEEEIKSIQQRITQLESQLESLKTQENQAVQDVTNIRTTANEKPDVIKQTADVQQRVNELDSETLAAQKNSEKIKDLKQQLIELEQEQKDAAAAGREHIAAMDEQNERSRQLEETMESLKSRIKDILSISSAFRGVTGLLRQTFETVKNLDKNFAEIAMVTDYSVQDMWSNYDNYAQMANDLGQSAQSVIQASGLFFQQGESRTSFIKEV